MHWVIPFGVSPQTNTGSRRSCSLALHHRPVRKTHLRRLVVGFGVLVAFLLLQAPVMAQTRVLGKTPSVALSATTTGKTTILGLRIGVHGSKTRIVMDMDGPVRFRSFALADPYRVVLDLPEVDFNLTVPRLIQKTGGVFGYRFGLFEPGTSRGGDRSGGAMDYRGDF